MASKRLCYAKRPFGYGGKQLDREQVFETQGLANDEMLERLGYMEELPRDADRRGYPCRLCGAKFVSVGGLEGHGRRAHVEKVKPVIDPRQDGETQSEFEQREAAWLASQAAEEDAEIDREERMLEEVAPLRLDMTTASRS